MKLLPPPPLFRALYVSSPGFSPVLSFLVDPPFLVLLVRHDLFLLEPQVNLLFSAFDAVRAVADVATDINSIITTDRTRRRCERVGGSENHLLSVSDIWKARDGVTGCILRPTLHASRPSQTMAQMGPLSMSDGRHQHLAFYGQSCKGVQVTRPLKNGLSERSA